MIKSEPITVPDTEAQTLGTVSDQIKPTKTKSIKKIELCRELNYILKSILGDEIRDMYFDNSEDEKKFISDYGLIKIKEKSDGSVPSDDEIDDDLVSMQDSRFQDLIIRDLFIWSILRNHIDMAKVFLARMKYRICGALIAKAILKEFYRKSNRRDHKKEYKTSADYFENYAIECVKCCDKMDEEQTDELVLQGIDFFGGITCLQVRIAHKLTIMQSVFAYFVQIAATANAKKFISTPGCVNAMKQVWYERMCIRTEGDSLLHYIRYFISLFSLGFLAPMIINFREKKVITETIFIY